MLTYYLIYTVYKESDGNVVLDSIDNIGWTTNVYFANLFKSYLEGMIKTINGVSSNMVIVQKFDHKKKLYDYLYSPIINISEFREDSDYKGIDDIELEFRTSAVDSKRGSLCTFAALQSYWVFVDQLYSANFYYLKDAINTLSHIPEKYFREKDVYCQLMGIVEKVRCYIELYMLRENFCDESYGDGCKDYDIVRDAFLKTTGINVDKYNRNDFFFGVFSELDYLNAFTDFEFMWRDS